MTPEARRSGGARKLGRSRARRRPPPSRSRRRLPSRLPQAPKAPAPASPKSLRPPNPKRQRRPRRLPRVRRTNGSKSSSRRPARRRHPRLEVQLVHRHEGLRRLPRRGHRDPQAHLREALARGPLGHPHPQGQAAHHDRHLHGPPGNRHRQVRRRGRRAAPRRARHDVEGRADQHQRDQAPRAGRPAGRAVHRRAAAEPRVVPARDEALALVLDALRRSGREGALRRTAGRLGDEPVGDLHGGSSAAAHAARRHRLRLLPGEDHVRRDRRQGLDQQGRDHARGLREHERQGRAARRPGSGAAPRRAERGPRRLVPRGCARPRPRRQP